MAVTAHPVLCTVPATTANNSAWRRAEKRRDGLAFLCPFFIEKRNGRKISMAIVEFKNVSRIYQSGDHELKALDNVSMKLDEGKFVVILGPSGAGKSTLLNLPAVLTARQAGEFMLKARIFRHLPAISLPNTERQQSASYFSFITSFRR